MKILHYALGFPPYRTGGMTKYCVDLMKTQVEDGHVVGLLWPGAIYPIGTQRIKRHSDWNGIQSYEVINPLPVALDEGVIQPELYTKKGNENVYKSFFVKTKPDVLHIHTLMGLHSELLKAAKECEIKVIYTSHDYYGLCPKVTLYHCGEVCTDNHCFTDCVSCNKSGLTFTKIAIMQSAMYRRFKKSYFVSFLRKKHREQFFSVTEEQEENKLNEDDCSIKAEQYMKLQSFYKAQLEMVDLIHFNSSVAKDVYLNYIHPRRYRVIPITHNDIGDHRAIKNFEHEKLRISYLGPTKPFKGFLLLKEALDELWNEEINSFELRVYNVIQNPSDYMIMQDGYNYSELEKIFECTDIMIAPSKWKETFGFTVLEALSYGVPVLVSSNVGAKDLLENLPEECVVDAEKDALKKRISAFIYDRRLLQNINAAICKTECLPDKLPYESIYNGGSPE